jgi:cardiolipin synthase
MIIPLVPILTIGLPLIELIVIVRILLRPHRDPASRIAWVVVVAMVPVVGILAYAMFGEVRAGTAGRARSQLHPVGPSPGSPQSGEVRLPERYVNLFRLCSSINGNLPVAGNSASLLKNSNAAIDKMVDDIDAAKRHVNVDFYIWLPDNNGQKIVAALCHAARRGISCRALADDVGSRALIRSSHWTDMKAAGVLVANALPVGNPVSRIISGRIDVRNHRKIVVIDGRITYCGSQNCADPEFLPKAKYAPWVDIMLRFEGPIVGQNQLLFADDWTSRTSELLPVAVEEWNTASGNMPALVIGTGPTIRYSAISEVFETLLFAARREITISTPYYVPDEAMHNALCTSAYRGVDTTLIVPARNDSWIVAAASRSYYADLAAAGVRIFEFEGGLLHAKTVTVDDEICLIGSANMDRRSFELNYENNILIFDAGLAAALKERQSTYLAQSQSVANEDIASWSMLRRLWNNAVATLGPLI